MTFQTLPGYMGNSYVKAEHVFVPGKGCFYETLEKAVAAYKKSDPSGNGVNHEVATLAIEGINVYNYYNTNVFD